MPCGFTEFKRQGLMTLIICCNFFPWVLRNLYSFRLCRQSWRNAAGHLGLCRLHASVERMNGFKSRFRVYPCPNNLLLRSATNSELSLQVSNFEGGFRIVLEFLQLSRSPVCGLICGGFHDRVFTSSMVKTHQECGFDE